MPPVIVRYPLDPTGVNPDNLVIGEEHVLSSRLTRSIAPIYGAYYAESMVLTDKATNLQLVRNQQWFPAELYEVPTALYGKEVFALVIITDPSVSNTVTINYQAVGGEYGSSEEAIINLIETIELDNRPVTWPNVLLKPSEYPPSLHLHDIGDVYGFEYLVHALNRIRMAVEYGDLASHEQIYTYIDNLFNNPSPEAIAKFLQAVADLNRYATLDLFGKLETSQLPDNVVNNMMINTGDETTLSIVTKLQNVVLDMGVLV